MLTTSPLLRNLLDQTFFAASRWQRQLAIWGLVGAGVLLIALFIGIVGPLLALVAALALIAGR